MPDWCPSCGAYGYGEYTGERHVKKCLQCNYRERIVYTTGPDRLRRLIKLHLKDLHELEEEEKKMDVYKCTKCGWVIGEPAGCEPRNPSSCKDYEKHVWKKIEFEKVIKK